MDDASPGTQEYIMLRQDSIQSTELKKRQSPFRTKCHEIFCCPLKQVHLKENTEPEGLCSMHLPLLLPFLLFFFLFGFPSPLWFFLPFLSFFYFSFLLLLCKFWKACAWPVESHMFTSDLHLMPQETRLPPSSLVFACLLVWGRACDFTHLEKGTFITVTKPFVSFEAFIKGLFHVVLLAFFLAAKICLLFWKNIVGFPVSSQLGALSSIPGVISRLLMLSWAGENCSYPVLET